MTKQFTRMGFLRLTAKTISAIALGSLGLLEYGTFESVWYKLNRKTLPLAGMPEAFDGLVLAHLSDLHFNPWTTPQRFAEVVEMVNGQSPDVIAITGDFIDGRTPEEQFPLIKDQLRRLKAKLGVFAVLGNHDYWRDAELVREMLSDCGIRELSNRAFPIHQNGEVLTLCGLDDVMESKQDLPALLAELPDSGFAVLLVHEPDYADTTSATGKFALQLSGHSHGGQVSIPFYGPPVTPSFAHNYPRGLYQVGEMMLYTTTGIGLVPPMLRLNCRPEVAVFTLTRKSSGK